MTEPARHLPTPADEQSRVRLELAMSAAQVGSFDWDVREDVLLWDERICAVFGIDPADFDSRIASFWQRVLPEDVAATQAALDAAMATCGEYAAEYRVRWPDGTVRWVEAKGRVLPGADGEAARLVGVALDTTELKQARDTVARALEHMADAFVAIDSGWTVTYLNHNAEALMATDASAVGRPLWDVWPGLVRSGEFDALRDTARTGRPGLFTTYDVATDRWWQIRLVPAADGSGALSLFGTDVTALRAARVESERELSRPEQARRVLAYTAALAEADSLQDVTDTVATMVLPAFGAAGMLVSLAESGRLRLAGQFGYAPQAVRMLDLVELDSHTPIAQVLRDRTPLFVPSRAAYLTLFPGREELVDATGKHAWAFLPLTVSGRALGSLTVSFPEEHDFPPEERSLLVSVSSLVAQTLARARLRDSERALASELQSHLLPRALPQPPGVSARAQYLPATDGMGIGGDWYDLLELPRNRIALVIGDVQGHNMKAAAVMGQLRNALRAYAAEGHEPAAVLSRTNRLMSELDPALFATCCYLALDVVSGRAELVLAGHPAPLVRATDGTVRQLEAPVGPPLGVWPEEEYRPAHLLLQPGEVVAMFTDGLVEDTRRPLDQGLAELGARLAAADAADLDVLADVLVAEGSGGQTRTDDIALLVVRHDGLPDLERPVHARLLVDRADPRAARAARDFIAGVIDDSHMVELRETCVLLVSEVVTNALRHTDGEVSLSMWRYPERLRVEVADGTSRGLVHTGGGPLDESGRGVPLMNALSSRWGTAPHGEGKVVWFELDLDEVG